jgi:hypothetical protein
VLSFCADSSPKTNFVVGFPAIRLTELCDVCEVEEEAVVVDDAIAEVEEDVKVTVEELVPDEVLDAVEALVLEVEEVTTEGEALDTKKMPAAAAPIIITTPTVIAACETAAPA